MYLQHDCNFYFVVKSCARQWQINHLNDSVDHLDLPQAYNLSFNLFLNLSFNLPTEWAAILWRTSSFSAIRICPINTFVYEQILEKVVAPKTTKTKEFTSTNIIFAVNECYNPCLSIHILLPLSTHLIFTYFLRAALSPPWIPKLGASPSQRIVCLNWKVSRGKLTNVANHFKTTFHFFPSFFFISLSIIFISNAAWEGPFIWEGEEERNRETVKKKKREMGRWWWCLDDYMWAGLNDFSPSDSSLLIIRPNSPPPSMEDIPPKSYSQREAESCTLLNNGWRLAMLDLRAQLQLSRVTLWGWFLSLVVKMICSSLSVTVFICNPKCGANFLPNKHGITAAHAHESRVMKAIAI